jgi:hypothetical protein
VPSCLKFGPFIFNKARMSNSEDNFANLLEGDDFLDEEAKAAQVARARRLKRKRRLETISKDQVKKIESVTNDTSATAKPEPISGPTAVSEAAGGGDIEKTSDEKEEGEEQVEFDMFSSSSSPPISRDTIFTRKPELDKNAGNVDQQQDWDDAEGYYKASIGKRPKFKACIGFQTSLT